MNFTESSSKYDNLEKKSILEILEGINAEDKTVPFAVEKA
ncbi:MAG: N-acetylmuramic acid 6-phosphate etherase, partial [Raineya sp.]